MGLRTSGTVDAVTFDFWNTLMWEEPGSLRETRLEIWGGVLAEAGASVDAFQLELAHDAAHEAYIRSWTDGNQFRVEDAVAEMLNYLDVGLGVNIAPALLEGFSEAGRRAAVHPSDGVHGCLDTLKGAGVRLGIICDIGLTPSPVVLELLDRHGLLGFFDDTSFSDEEGHYKPARAFFQLALARLGAIPPERAAHVGDRRRTDVGGAMAMGMISVRYNGVYEDEAIGAPEADIVLADMADLPLLLGVAEISR